MQVAKYLSLLKEILYTETNINIVYDKINRLHSSISSYSNYIVIIFLKEIGDFVLLTSFLHALRDLNKDSYIVFIGYKHIYDLFELCPYIDKIITIKSIKQSKEINSADLQSFLPIIENILSNGFPSVMINPYWYDYDQLANILMWLSAGKKRIAYAETDYQQYLSTKDFSTYTCIDKNFLTDRIHVPFNIIHTLERNLYILIYLYGQYLNCSYKYYLYEHSYNTLTETTSANNNLVCKDTAADNTLINKDKLINSNILFLKNKYKLELFISEKDYVNIDKTKFNIVIGLGGSTPSKKYPIKKWEKVITVLHNSYPEINFIAIGNKNDEFLNLPFIINYINKLSIRQTISLIGQCNLYIGHDTCFVHIASVYNIPQVVLYKESLQKLNYYRKKKFNGYLSAYDTFTPLSDHIALFPKKSMYPCSEKEIIINGCKSLKSHCISRINENDIINVTRKILNKYYLNKN